MSHQMLYWVAQHATSLCGKGGSSSIEAEAARLAHVAKTVGYDLTIERVGVDADVAEKRTFTGIKAFDEGILRQQGKILDGNVWGDFQFSSFVRPASRLECNGQINPPGHLRDFDLKPFAAANFNGFDAVRRWLTNHQGDRTVIVYCFRNRTKVNGRVKDHIYGYLVTDDRHELLASCPVASNGRQVLKCAEQFVSTAHFKEPRQLVVKVRAGEVEIFDPAVREAYAFEEASHAVTAQQAGVEVREVSAADAFERPRARG